jgi:hypothetical protein
MSRKTHSLVAFLALCFISACDGTERGVLDPTPLGTGPTTVGIQSSVVSVQSIGQAVCPALPPFVGSLNLTVQAIGGLDVRLTHVRMAFTDSVGLTAPAVTLPAPVLTQQFGSTLVEARSQRAFPFSFPFGCGTRRTGTLVVIVIVTDEDGRERTEELRAAVR